MRSHSSLAAVRVNINQLVATEYAHRGEQMSLGRRRRHFGQRIETTPVYDSTGPDHGHIVSAVRTEELSVSPTLWKFLFGERSRMRI